MPTVQDTYLTAPARGYAGMVANGELDNRISRTCEDAGGIPFGAPVYRGAAEHGCTATVGTAATFLGFAIADKSQVPLPGGVAADKYAQYSTVSILTQGAILVSAIGANAVGAAVTVGKSGGAADGIGDTAADATHIGTNGWVFDEATSADAIAKIVKR